MSLDPLADRRRAGLVGASLTGLLGLLLAVAPPAAAQGPIGVPTPGRPEVLATGLGTVTSLAMRDRRTAAVARGHGSVDLVSHGTASVLVPPLPEEDFRTGYTTGGLAWDRGQLYYTIFGEHRETDSSYLMVRAPDGRVREVADLGEFGHEAAANPDAVNTYGYLDGLDEECRAQFFHDNPFEHHDVVYPGDGDSRPLATAVGRRGVVVADSEANDVLVQDRRGLRTLSVLAPVVASMTADAAPSQENTPECALGERYAFEPYPADVELDRDGRLYVSALPESARGSDPRPLGVLYRAHPRTGTLTVAAQGLVAPREIAVGPWGEVYVAERSRVSVVPRGWSTARSFLSLAGVTTLEVEGRALYLTTADGDLLRVPLRR